MGVGFPSCAKAWRERKRSRVTVSKWFILIGFINGSSPNLKIQIRDFLEKKRG
jgi:hypothetical protein